MGEQDGHRVGVHLQRRFLQGAEIVLYHALIHTQTFVLAFVGSFGCSQDAVGMQVGQTTHQRPLSSRSAGEWKQ